MASSAYGLKPEVWGRVGPDPRAELHVDPARGQQAQGLGWPGYNITFHGYFVPIHWKTVRELTNTVTKINAFIVWWFIFQSVFEQVSTMQGSLFIIYTHLNYSFTASNHANGTKLSFKFTFWQQDWFNGSQMCWYFTQQWSGIPQNCNKEVFLNNTRARL